MNDFREGVGERERESVGAREAGHRRPEASAATAVGYKTSFRRADCFVTTTTCN